MNIVPIVKLLPASLKELYLGYKLFGEGVKANWSHLTKLEWVHIDGSRITGTEDELEAVLPEGCYACGQRRWLNDASHLAASDLNALCEQNLPFRGRVIKLKATVPLTHQTMIDCS